MPEDQEHVACKLGCDLECPQSRRFRMDCSACRQAKEHLVRLEAEAQELRNRCHLLAKALREAREANIERTF